MRNIFKSLLVFSTILLSVHYSPRSSAASLTQAECAKLQSDLQIYEVEIQKYFGTGSIVEKLIALAKADVAKVCPNVYNNEFSVNSEFECNVVDSTSTTAVSLGVDSSFNLVNLITPFKTACMSATACTSIAAQKFGVFGASQTARCSDPNDQTVYHLTDAQMQTKINAVP